MWNRQYIMDSSDKVKNYLTLLFTTYLQQDDEKNSGNIGGENKSIICAKGILKDICGRRAGT